MTKIAGRKIKHDLTGQTFGRLTVLERNPVQKGVKTQWKCRCECGTEVSVSAGNLLRKTRSCGCLHLEMLRQPRKHGATIRTSGQGLTREYRSWNAAKIRCRNVSYDHFERYGGRGIIMCERWLGSFANFLSDMGTCPPGHELDRIDNDGPYSPENCRWATRREQMNNTSATRWVEHGGRRMSVADWSRETGIPYHKLIQRLRSGWPVEKALSH